MRAELCACCSPLLISQHLRESILNSDISLALNSIVRTFELFNPSPRKLDTNMSPSSHDDSILIVGAGAFGLSTALELKERGFKEVTVIDRMMPPVPDGSSVDISRIIRYDYTDPFYATLAKEAADVWKSSSLYSPFYHQSGYVLASESGFDASVEEYKAILKSEGQPFTEFQSTDELKQLVPELSDIGNQFSGYFNPRGGWANAEGAIRALAARCSESGVSFITGPRGTIASLKMDENSRVVGVNVISGPPLLASKVILATGAWTNNFVNLDRAIISSAQPIGFVQLTEEEARACSNVPVVDNLTTGVFFFPPTPDTHILKVAYHGHGFENEVFRDSRVISSPKLDGNNATSLFLPEDADLYLRKGLRQLMPRFAGRAWLRTRMCWYTDTANGDFIADYHPSYDGLFIATGGSGQLVLPSIKLVNLIDN